jgi:hypothetical protein
MKTDVRRLADALDRKRAKQKCHACGESEWIALETTSILSAMDEQQVVRPGIGVEVAAVICSRCGFVRLHSTHHLFAGLPS